MLLMKWFSLLLLVGVSMAAQSTEITQTELPKAALSTLAALPGKSINKVLLDRTTTHSYLAHLSDGTVVSFDEAGDWMEVANPSGVPQDLLPANLRSEISKKYAGQKIVLVYKSDSRIYVDLEKTKSLQFTDKNQLIKID